MQPSDVIQRLDERLQQHEQFGQSPKIIARVAERYRFALDVLAGRDARLRGLADRVEGLDGASADALFGDLLVRAELEAAIGRLESSGPLDASIESLGWLLGEALGAPGGGRLPGVARRAMGRDFAVGPARRTWVWDLPEGPTPTLDRLRESIRTGFMPGAESGVEIIRPTPRMVERLDRACSLLGRLVPRVAESVFLHLHSIAVANIRGPRGRMLTGSGGDGTPCMIFIDPDELENPWDTAGHILHEGVHLKLSDLIRTGAIVTDEGPVELPWGRRTALSNCVFAYHAYAHMRAFRAAVEHLGPALHAEFGAPHDYQAPAHAMSVVNNASTAPFSQAHERLNHLHEQLGGPLAPRLTPVGRSLVAWLWDAIDPAGELGPPPPAAGAAARAPAPAPLGPSSARYRHNRGVPLRRSPSAEALFALEPGSQKIVTLNLAAWLAFELCDGKTEREVLSAYAAATGLGADRAWVELAPALGELRASGMIVPASEGARAREEVSP
ncbi:MAG TPA: HEXXH motif-containing putative peptide modification protein [Polyangiaceae bacterium]|nr:HEXXH motif-containing putative peptide modification protein [Polyangiaceae bacterium]